jgi:hypothetical protein
MNDLATAAPLGALARQEMRNYLKSGLFWVGLALTTLGFAQQFLFPDKSGTDFGAAWLGLVIAAGIGLFGIGVMTGMVRRSDRLAAAAGAAATSERERTLALASAVVVPATAGFVFWLVEVVGFYVQGHDVPNAYDGVPDAHLHAFSFGQGVMASIGGPVLGLVAARYLRSRGMAVLLSVVMITVTILMQGIFQSTLSWRMVWVWTQWAGPTGLDGDTLGGEDAFGLFPGSPYFWIAYLAAVCTLGVLAALYHDPESDRQAYRKAMAAVAAVAVVCVLLSMAFGVDGVIVNRIPQ